MFKMSLYLFVLQLTKVHAFYLDLCKTGFAGQGNNGAGPAEQLPNLGK